MRVTLRQGKIEDLPYIIETWVGQATRHGIRAQHVKPTAIHRLKTSAVTVACLPDDEDAIIGYGVFEAGRVHMLYVRSSARRLGVANAMCRKVWR